MHKNGLIAIDINDYFRGSWIEFLNFILSHLALFEGAHIHKLYVIIKDAQYARACVQYQHFFNLAELDNIVSKCLIFDI